MLYTPSLLPLHVEPAAVGGCLRCCSRLQERVQLREPRPAFIAQARGVAAARAAAVRGSVLRGHALSLFFRRDTGESDVLDSLSGSQQGDPFGPFLFSLAIHDIITGHQHTLSRG